MRRFLSLLIAITLSGLTLTPPQTRGQHQTPPTVGKFRRVQDSIPDQYIVVLKDDVPAADVASHADGLSRAHGGLTEHIYTHALKGFSVRMSEPAAQALSRNPRVEYVAEDGEVHGFATQFNPPSWGLDRVDQRDLPLNSQYTYSTTGAGVNAYVIDTGIRPTHVDFGGRASVAADFVGDGQNGNDCNGHGTHVAGTVGGNSYGVAKGVTIRAVRVLGCSGNGTWSGVIAGVDWVTANHVKPAVANMSLGGGAYDPVDQAVRNSIASGVTYVVAAGNDYGLDASQKSPARVAEALTVGATDISDVKADFSNVGPLVDIFAPGVSITSAWIGSDTATNTIPGTSMASPHVAGVAALYLQNNPGAPPATVSAAIVNNASPNRVIDPGLGSPNRLLFSSARQNVALAANGGVATASSTHSAGFPASGANNGDRKGLNWGAGGGWNDASVGSFPDWLQVDFNGTKTIEEVNVFTVQDNVTDPVEPTDVTTFTQYGITAFNVQYWNGTSWATVPGGSITGNNKVWRKFTFNPVTTDRIRVLVNNSLASYSRITEVEAFEASAPPIINVALAGNGGVATASSTHSAGFPASAVNNGDRKGLTWGAGGGWNDATPDAYPDWVQIDFNGSKTISEIDVFTLQDAYANPVEPDDALTFSNYGVSDFSVQYWDGAAWVTVPGGSVTGNSLVKRRFTFSPLTTSKIRVLINNARANYSRLTEVEAYERVNHALATNGGVVTASSTHSAGFPASAVNNGDRKGLTWGAGGGWNDATPDAYPDWVQIDFNGSKTISEIDVFTLRDDFTNPAEPTDSMTFTQYGITAFEVQYWDGSTWVTVPGGSVTGNNRIKRTFTFAPLTTDRVRVLVSNALASYSRLTEVEVY